MDFRKKLSSLSDPRGRPRGPSQGEASPQSGGGAEDGRVERLRALIGEVVERDRRRGPRTPRLSANGPAPPPQSSCQQTEHGELHVVDELLEPDAAHGRVAVGGALGLDAELVAKLCLDPAVAEVDLDGMLIVDTETTGLAGGTGTVPFLIGCAFFEQGVLRVEQLFLRSFGEEGPMLRRLGERIAAADCLVSYNGKTFDWPLLRTRFIMNRIAAPELPPHLDLLHCARRVLKPRMQSVRLTAVERELLGFHRQDDVDGSLIPGLYLAYLRGGDPEPLSGVLEHNRHDLVALAAILAELSRQFQGVVAEDEPESHLAYARVAARANDRERALQFAKAAAEGGGEASTTVAALCLTAEVARRGGDAPGAVEALRRALPVADDGHALAQLHFSLAKLYEHALKDPARAYAHARGTAAAEGDQAHGRRLGRLHRRLLGR